MNDAGSDDTILDSGDTLLRRLRGPALGIGDSISGDVALLDPGSTLQGKYVLIVLDADEEAAESNESNVFPTGVIP